MSRGKRLLTFAICAFGLAGCRSSTAPVAASGVCDNPDPGPDSLGEAQYIVQKRAWEPGERQALINQITTTHSLIVPPIGDLSDLAADIYSDTVCVSEIALNPRWHAPASSSGALFDVAGVEWGTGFSANAVNFTITDNTRSPSFTWRWSGLYWVNNTYTDWVGFLLGAANTSGLIPTSPVTYVYTPNWNRDSATVGAGGGEMRESTGQYWEMRGPLTGPMNQIQITSLSFGTGSTVTSGVWKGSVETSGSMKGRAISVPMVGVLPSGSPPATQTVDLNFSTGGGLTAVRIVCTFPSPCTSAASSALVASLRGRQTGTFLRAASLQPRLPRARRA